MDKTNPFWRMVSESAEELYDLHEIMTQRFLEDGVEQFNVFRDKQGTWWVSYRDVSPTMRGVA